MHHQAGYIIAYGVVKLMNKCVWTYKFEQNIGFRRLSQISSLKDEIFIVFFVASLCGEHDFLMINPSGL